MGKEKKNDETCMFKKKWWNRHCMHVQVQELIYKLACIISYSLSTMLQNFHSPIHSMKIHFLHLFQEHKIGIILLWSKHAPLVKFNRNAITNILRSKWSFGYKYGLYSTISRILKIWCRMAWLSHDMKGNSKMKNKKIPHNPILMVWLYIYT